MYAGLVGVISASDTNKAIGSIKTQEGEAMIVRNVQEIKASIGTRIHAQDVIRTGKKGAVGIVLLDDTTVSLGPKSELKMNEFNFQPSESTFSMAMNMLKGTFVYVSGRMAKLAPESVKVKTPVGVVAVRGTKFLVEIPAED